MELSKIDIAACIVPKDPNNEIISDSTNDKYSSFYLQNLKVTSSIKDVQLTLREDDKTIKSWTIDHAIEPDSTTSDGRQKLADFVIKGYDVATLSISIGDMEQLHEQRENNLLLLLNLLQSKIDHYQPIDIKLEYAYLGVSDSHCYDLRKDRERSGESINSEGGLDLIMKEVHNVNDIWLKVEQLVETPFILVIKLTNDATNTIGRLTVFDLLHPESISEESKYACYKSYLKLHDIIRSINGKPDLFSTLIETDCHIILDVLMKYLCGQNKLTIFIYSNDIINNNDNSKELIKCMDIFTKLRNTPVRMIRNKYVNRHSKEYKDKFYVEQLKEYNNNLKTINAQLKKSEGDLKSRLSLQDMVNLELKNRIIYYEANEKVKEKQIEFLKIARQQGIEESKLYSEALLKTIEVQQTLIDFQLSDNIDRQNDSRPLIKVEENHSDLSTTKSSS